MIKVIIGTSLNGGGVSKHFTALAGLMANRGHQLTIIAPHRRLDLVDTQTNPAIYTWPSDRPTHPRDGLWLCKLLGKLNPDILIGNFAAVNLMSLVGWLRRVPCRIAWYRTLTQQINLDSRLPTWRLRLLRQRKKLVFKTATHLVGNSQAALEDLITVYGVPVEKCRVAFNSLRDPLAAPTTDCPVPVAGKIMCVGRLDRCKGQDVLIHAMAIVRREQPQAHLDLIGGGRFQGELAALVRSLGLSDCCHFFGPIPHDHVLTCMRQASVLITPSRSEAFGWTNIEAMSVGTPVIGSAVGGIPEIIQDGINGFLVPPDAPEILAERITRVLANSALRQRLSRSARERFLAVFEQTAAITEQAKWLESLV